MQLTAISLRVGFVKAFMKDQVILNQKDIDFSQSVISISNEKQHGDRDNKPLYLKKSVIYEQGILCTQLLKWVFLNSLKKLSFHFYFQILVYSSKMHNYPASGTKYPQH